MTNVQSYLETAVELLEKNELRDSEATFINSIKNYDKKQLKKLSQKQYDWLKAIANKS